MPGFGTTTGTLENARALARAAGVALREIDIRAACTQHLRDIGVPAEDTASVVFENAQARERTQVLMDLANKEGALYVGTGDLSEMALGWMTFGADQISMYHVNSGVPKTLVRRLVGWVADHESTDEERRVLHAVLDTPVSPELLPPDSTGGITQKTEDVVGPYELHDFFLFALLRLGAGPRKMLFLAGHAFEGRYDAADRAALGARVRHALLRPAVQAVDVPRRPQGRVGQPVAAGRLAHAQRRVQGGLARRARRRKNSRLDHLMTAVLICSHGDVKKDLGGTLLWRDDIERQVVTKMEEAQMLAVAARPRLVVIDRDLPWAARIVTALREDPSTRALSLVVMARGDFDPTEIELLECGANAILRLPAGPDWNERLERLMDVPVRKEARFPVSFDVEAASQRRRGRERAGLEPERQRNAHRDRGRPERAGRRPAPGRAAGLHRYPAHRGPGRAPGRALAVRRRVPQPGPRGVPAHPGLPGHPRRLISPE